MKREEEEEGRGGGGGGGGGSRRWGGGSGDWRIRGREGGKDDEEGDSQGTDLVRWPGE